MLSIIKINDVDVEVHDIFDITLEVFAERVSDAKIPSDRMEELFIQIKNFCSKFL